MASGATVVAAATGTAVAAPQMDAPVSRPDTAKGYHETPHIRTYYQRARI